MDPPLTVAISSPLLAFAFTKSRLKPGLRLLSREELGRLCLRRRRFAASFERLLALATRSPLDFISLWLVWLSTNTCLTLPRASICWVLYENPLIRGCEACLSSLFISSPSFSLLTSIRDPEASYSRVWAWCRPPSETRTASLLGCPWLPFRDLSKLAVFIYALRAFSSDSRSPGCIRADIASWKALSPCVLALGVLEPCECSINKTLS